MLKTVLVDYNPLALLLDKIFSKVTVLGDISNHVKDLLYTKEDSSL